MKKIFLIIFYFLFFLFYVNVNKIYAYNHKKGKIYLLLENYKKEKLFLIKNKKDPILNNYNISEKKLYKNNSKLGLQSINILSIQNHTSQNHTSQNHTSQNHTSQNHTSTINLMFMLPLLINPMNNEELKNKQIIGKDALFFYLGAKYASNLLSKKKKINILVFDTKNQKNRIKQFLNTYNFNNIHAIIGPFFRSSLEEVAKKQPNIPVISPFVNSDILNNYPNVIQSEVNNFFLIQPILEEIKLISKKEKIHTLYLIGTKKSEKMVNNIKKQLLQWNEKFQIFFLNQNFKFSSFKNNPFFYVFLGGDTFFVKKFVNNIKFFSKKKIKPFGIGYNEVYYQYRPLLKKYKFMFTTKYHFNKKNSKIFYLFKKQFGKNLNKYQLLGFDLTYDILERFCNNINLFKNIEKKNFIGIINKYHYQKIYNEGGYFNTGIWIIRF